MRAWLQSILDRRVLSEEAEGYLLGRGMREETYRRLGIVQWVPPDAPAPDPEFVKHHGSFGKHLEGRIMCPALSPRGELLGFETRSWRWGEGKHISDYRLPEAAWNPFFLGLTPDAMERIWQGGEVWIVEGLFDLAPLERVVPSKDVVLATVRAKLSESHVEFLRRYVRKGRVNMVYDRDPTGRKQTVGWEDETGKRRWGAMDLLRRVGVSCRDVYYQGGKDPGEIWDKGGEAALRQAFAAVL